MLRNKNELNAQRCGQQEETTHIHQNKNAKKLLKKFNMMKRMTPTHPKHIRRRRLYDAARTRIERKTPFWKLSNLKQNVSQHQYTTSEALNKASTEESPDI